MPPPTSTRCSVRPTRAVPPTMPKRAACRRPAQAAAPKLAAAVTRSMQQLGMAGGRFEVALTATDGPQSFGLESAEFLVAGHAGSTPRPLGKVASGGELSRIALSIAVVTSELDVGAGDAVDADLRRGRRRRRRRRRRDRRPADEAARPRSPGAGRDPPAAGGRLRRPPSRRGQGRRRRQQARSSVRGVGGEPAWPRSPACSAARSCSSTSLAHAQEMLRSSADDAVPLTRAPRQPRRARPAER